MHTFITGRYVHFYNRDFDMEFMYYVKILIKFSVQTMCSKDKLLV